jgi:hypothetical protein
MAILVVFLALLTAGCSDSAGLQTPEEAIPIIFRLTQNDFQKISGLRRSMRKENSSSICIPNG